MRTAVASADETGDAQLSTSRGSAQPGSQAHRCAASRVRGPRGTCLLQLDVPVDTAAALGLNLATLRLEHEAPHLRIPRQAHGTQHAACQRSMQKSPGTAAQRRPSPKRPWARAAPRPAHCSPLQHAKKRETTGGFARTAAGSHGTCTRAAACGSTQETGSEQRSREAAAAGGAGHKPGSQPRRSQPCRSRSPGRTGPPCGGRAAPRGGMACGQSRARPRAAGRPGPWARPARTPLPCARSRPPQPQRGISTLRQADACLLPPHRPAKSQCPDW